MNIHFDAIFEEKDANAVLTNTAMISDLGLTKQFIMKDLGVTSRVFNHWALKGLVDIRPKQNGHNHIFSFVELIWFNIVKELREFGFPLDKIKLVYDSLMEKFDFVAYIVAP